MEAWIRLEPQAGGLDHVMIMAYGFFEPNEQGLDLYVCSAWHSGHNGGLSAPSPQWNGSNFSGDHHTQFYNCLHTPEGCEGYRRICDGEFHHVAHVRSGGYLRLYHDGTPVASAPFTVPVDPKTELFVGSRMNDCPTHPKEVSEFRIIRGQARYHGPFTPPKRAFPIPTDG